MHCYVALSYHCNEDTYPIFKQEAAKKAGML